VLRRYALSGTIEEVRGREAIEDLADLPIERLAHEPLMKRAWALRASLTAYDAMYVVLAEGLGAPLLTRDRRLAAAHGHAAKIELV
jgi:predicted nucleic acid-binding protein